MDKLLFGTAYYNEYMPYERLARDIDMMKKANINTVRIAESTWSTCEPQDAVFDFSCVERVMDYMEEAGINVIIGTPTYALPTWLVKAHPDVLATTKSGRGIYGARQIMDITNPTYLYYSERIIRKLLECSAHRKCVIGFQLDNETKYYGTAGRNVQKRFVKYLRQKFQDNLEALNHEFGLDYWSNRINAWEDFPDVRGTINGSLGAEFEKFQRSLVDEFLSWQAGIVREYCREEQFITHNFDFEWRGYSAGIQPDVNQYHAAKALSIAGADIYHPSQDRLTGIEIAFGGDLIRSLKQDNYLILETQAQGFTDWTPYRGQLRLQAYSHIASGSNSVMYWHWHSIHNSFETYWKGLLSHDFCENETYKEACVIGEEFAKFGKQLVNLKKKNAVAILVSNEALTALKWFGITATTADNGNINYNDVVHWIYDALYEMNVECDFIWPESENFDQYRVIAVPALYAVPDTVLKRLNSYVKAGGTLIATFKTAFANENVKVSYEVQPHILCECLGVNYHQFTFPNKVKLSGELAEGVLEREAKTFMELLIPTTAKTLLSYEHYNWSTYCAVTQNHYGSGTGVYIGCMMEKTLLKKLLYKVLSDAKVQLLKSTFPVIIRSGQNAFGKTVRFYLNYSCETQKLIYQYKAGVDVLSGKDINPQDDICISPWNLRIIAE